MKSEDDKDRMDWKWWLKQVKNGMVPFPAYRIARLKRLMKS